MQDSQKVHWKRIAAEGAAIVASILLAFTIDAWWDERQDRKMERDDLERLHAEFVWNRDRIGDFGTPARAAAASAELYKSLAVHLGQDGPLEIQNALIETIRRTPTFDDVTPVLDGLILSGRLDNIRDREVLLAISYWQRHIQQVQQVDLGARQFVFTELVPALAKRGNMGPTYDDVDSGGVTSVMVDDELVSLVGHRASNTRLILRTHNALKDAANDAITAVEQAQYK